jgi:integrase
MRLTDLADKFYDSMRRRDLSPRTINAYRWAIHDLVDKAMAPARLTEVTDLTREVLEDWQDAHVSDWIPRTRGLASVAIRQFLKFGIENDYIADAKLPRALAKVKQPDPEPHPIPEEDLVKIKAALLPYPEGAGVVALRNRALFFFILATAGRVSEILQVRVDDYTAPNVIQKGGTRKTLGVPPEACQLVRDYLSARVSLHESPYLWISYTPQTRGRLMTPGQVRRVWLKLCAEIGVSYWTTHEIRHSCATELLKAKVPHLVIANHMGHHGLATISNYAKVLDEAKREVMSIMGAGMRLTSEAA